MNILILGGTSFLGRHIVQACLDADHAVTTFTRGKTNPQLFPEVGRLIGDRDSDLQSVQEAARDRAAAGNSFDACIDVSGYTPAQVERSLDAVANRVGRYLFISSVATYRAPVPANVGEEAPVKELENPHVEVSAESYGGLKVICERMVEKRMGGRALSLRLGVVAGPWDPSDRVAYWCFRVLGGDEISLGAGVTYRPYQETIDDTLLWRLRESAELEPDSTRTRSSG